MRLVVLDEAQIKIEPGETKKSNIEVPVKWWSPFRCGKKNTVITSNGNFGAGCGSRACLDCHTKKIRKSVSAIEEIKKYKNSSMYAIVLSPKIGRIKSVNDVNDFLVSFRKLLRKWQRSHFLNFGYWVAECVVKENEERTRIPCPIGLYLDDNYYQDEQTAHENCKNGICDVCKGSGFLPSVHLHIHLVICCKSFWYGKGVVSKKYKDQFYDFNGIGFKGFIEKEGIGVSKCQLLKKRSGMCDYVSKACLNYISKVDKSTNEAKEIDWKKSQIGCMIASYIYGKKRHRGSCGDIYGLTKKSKDVTNYISVIFEPPKEVKPNSVEALKENYQRPTKEKRENNGKYLEILGIGLKAQDVIIDQITDFSNVLINTELDIAENKIYVLENDKIRKSKSIQSKTLSNKWFNSPVIQKKDVWCLIDNSHLIIGRGDSVISIPKNWLYIGGFNYLIYLLNFIKTYSYQEWHCLFYYLNVEKFGNKEQNENISSL